MEKRFEFILHEEQSEELMIFDLDSCVFCWPVIVVFNI